MTAWAPRQFPHRPGGCPDSKRRFPAAIPGVELAGDAWSTPSRRGMFLNEHMEGVVGRAVVARGEVKAMGSGWKRRPGMPGLTANWRSRSLLKIAPRAD
jgi:hypothetical protein